MVMIVVNLVATLWTSLEPQDELHATFGVQERVCITNVAFLLIPSSTICSFAACKFDNLLQGKARFDLNHITILDVA